MQIGHARRVLGAVSQSRIGSSRSRRLIPPRSGIRTPSRIARASEDYVLMALGNHA